MDRFSDICIVKQGQLKDTDPQLFYALSATGQLDESRHYHYYFLVEHEKHGYFRWHFKVTMELIKDGMVDTQALALDRMRRKMKEALDKKRESE